MSAARPPGRPSLLPQALRRRLASADLGTWFEPGIHVKRWLALMMLGVAIVGLGLAYLLRQTYEVATLPEIFYYITLQFIPRYVRGLLFLAVGPTLIVVGLVSLLNSLLEAATRPGARGPLAKRLRDARLRSRNGRSPRIVAIGGGTGLSRLLLGLKDHDVELTAIVSVGDDGGSSGRLRREFGVLPPGDVRNCIAALAEAPEEMRALFQHRFEESSELKGHSLGNLLIVALTEITGSFEEAVRAMSRILAVRGQIIPLTSVDITLGARMDDGEMVWGESSITHRGKRIERLYLRPANAHAYPEALEAIADADLIVMGPGSLYTSVLPNLLVEDIRDAVRRARALKVYVSNVATQHGETDDFTVADHVRAILAHTGPGLIDCVLANADIAHELPEAWRSQAVRLGDQLPDGIRLVKADVVQSDKRYHHDPDKLARAILALYHDREVYAIADLAATRLPTRA